LSALFHFIAEMISERLSIYPDACANPEGRQLATGSLFIQRFVGDVEQRL
jgi:hypothetical protein